jgi:hypothetical protein
MVPSTKDVSFGSFMENDECLHGDEGKGNTTKLLQT